MTSAFTRENNSKKMYQTTEFVYSNSEFAEFFAVTNAIVEPLEILL